MNSTPIADMVEELLLAETPGHLVVLAIRACEVSRTVTRDERDAVKREQGRVRQQKCRDRKRNGGGMAAHAGDNPERDVTRDGRDSTLILSSSFPPLKKEETEEVRKEESKKERARNKRKPAVQLPADWQPNAAHFAKAKALGRPDGFVESKAEDLRIWAEANDARKQNWDATFHGFIRRDNGVSHGKTSQRGGSVIAAADKLIGKLADLNRPAPDFGGTGAICSGEGASPVRLLPKG